MNKNNLYDKIFSQLYNQRKIGGFFSIYTWVEKELGIDDEIIINDIIENMLDLNWIEQAEYSKYDFCLTYTGTKDFEEYGSYSSYKKSKDSYGKKNQREKKIKEYIQIGFAILFGLSTLTLGWINYYNDIEIDKQRTNINNLRIKINTLEKETDSLTYLVKKCNNSTP